MIIGIAPLAVVALVAVPAGAHVLPIGQGGFRRIFKHDTMPRQHRAGRLRAHAPEKKICRGDRGGESLTTRVPKKAGKRGDRPPRASCKPQRERAGARVPTISLKQAALLQQHYRLSERETEVMELIARGGAPWRASPRISGH